MNLLPKGKVACWVCRWISSRENSLYWLLIASVWRWLAKRYMLRLQWVSSWSGGEFSILFWTGILLFQRFFIRRVAIRNYVPSTCLTKGLSQFSKCRLVWVNKIIRWCAQSHIIGYEHSGQESNTNPLPTTTTCLKSNKKKKNKGGHKLFEASKIPSPP